MTEQMEIDLALDATASDDALDATVQDDAEGPQDQDGAFDTALHDGDAEIPDETIQHLQDLRNGDSDSGGGLRNSGNAPKQTGADMGSAGQAALVAAMAQYSGHDLGNTSTFTPFHIARLQDNPFDWNSGDSLVGWLADSQSAATATPQTRESATDSGNNYEIETRFVPNDTLFGNQWHLNNTGQSGGTPGVDLNLLDIWEEYTGKGVTVGVWDDGVQFGHHDLDDNYDASLHITVNGTVHNPDPENVNSAHGTAVAGVIAAENNGTGTVGVAFDATIAGVDIFYDSVHDFVATSAMTSELYNFDVTNHSWGFTGRYGDSVLSADPFFVGFFAGIMDSTVNGRGGLGTINMVAAGNDRLNGRDANDSNFNGMAETIAIGAVGHDGMVSWYSTPGAAVLVAGPSNGPAGGGIWTTDRTGGDGYSTGGNEAGNPNADYTALFGGTSSATPAVAGVVALMLEANSALGWRDVQDILAATARHTGTAVGSAPTGNELYEWAFNGANNWNGGGMHFSNDYGFGLVDAHAAVRLAESWTQQDTNSNWRVKTADSDVISLLPPDGDPGGATHIFNVGPGKATELEHVSLRLDFDESLGGAAGGFAWFDDYIFTLTSPDGTVSQFGRGEGSGNTDSWIFTSNAFRGETGVGNWTLNIVDAYAGLDGTFTFAELTFLGNVVSTDDLYVFTNEFSDYAGGPFGHTLGAQDTNGGTDTVNFAAVSSDVTANLNNGTGNVDGVAIGAGGFSGIENAIGGDGDDDLTGTGGANELTGMRGRDTIDGRGGNDDIIGGAGGDHLTGGGGIDDIFGGDGNDLMYGNAGADDLSGGKGGDKMFGGNGGDNMIGGAGNDTMNGGSGQDTMFGGAKNDIINGGNGNDVIDGGIGKDTIDGGNNSDMIDGGAGDDMITGGLGLDVIIFAGAFGNDTVSDFSANDGEDIDLSGVSSITGFNDLVNNHLFNSGGFAMIVAGINSILLDGVAFADVGSGQLYSSDDFIF